jgi:hypothetical protein
VFRGFRDSTVLSWGKCATILKKPIYWNFSVFQCNILYMYFENKIDTTYYISHLCPQHIMWLRNEKHRIISLRVITAICKSRIITRKLNNRICGLNTLSAYQYSLVTEMLQNFSFPIHSLGLLQYYKSTREITCIQVYCVRYYRTA